MNKSEIILRRHLNVSESEFQDLGKMNTLKAMEDYAIRQMIDENLSILKIAKGNMNDKTIIKIQNRIFELEKSLTRLAL